MQSPFKFLDTYERTDKYRYFGRERETAQLYNAVFAANLTLLYGASGVGKSSLIQCGLANKFYDTDWQPIFVRRAEDINAALDRARSHTGLLRRVRLISSPSIGAPAAAGILRPTIIIPASTALTVVELETILTHECAHIARHE